MGIGPRIKEAREKLGLTQTELGRLVGVTGSAITNYENNTSHPKEQILYKLLEALKVDANYLFQDEMSSPNNNILSLEEQYHISLYKKLNEDGKRMADTYVKDLTENPKYTNDKSTVNPENLTTTDIVQMFRNATAGSARIAASDGKGSSTVDSNLTREEVQKLLDDLVQGK